MLLSIKSITWEPHNLCLEDYGKWHWWIPLASGHCQ